MSVSDMKKLSTFHCENRVGIFFFLYKFTCENEVVITTPLVFVRLFSYPNPYFIEIDLGSFVS